MPTVVDELVITLGLDGSKFDSEASRSQAVLKRVGDMARREGKSLEEATRKQQDSTKQRVQEVSDATSKSVGSMRRLTVEVAALFGAFAASGYGLERFLRSVVNTEANTSRLSKTIGNISSRDLRALGQMAEQVGGSTDAVNQSLLGLSQNIAGYALTGQSPLAQFFRALKEPIADDNNKLRDMTDILKGWAKNIEGMPIPESTYLLRSVGLDDATIRQMQEGSAKFSAALDAARKGGPSDEDMRKAEIYQKNLVQLEQTLNNIAITIANEFLPEINQLILSFGRWVELNKDWLKQDIIAYIRQSIEGITEFAKEINKIVEAVGGWKNVTEGLFALWAFSKIQPILVAIGSIGAAIVGVTGSVKGLTLALAGPGGLLGPLAALFAAWGVFQLGLNDKGEFDINTFNKNAQKGLRGESGSGKVQATDSRVAEVGGWLKEDLGIDDGGAAALIANLDAESGLNPKAENPDSHALGWAQWLGPRKKEFLDFAAAHPELGGPGTDATNRAFLAHELKNKYPDILQALRDPNMSKEEKARLVNRKFEVPSLDKDELERIGNRRAGLTDQYQRAIKNPAPKEGGTPIIGRVLDFIKRTAPGAAGDAPTPVEQGSWDILSGALRTPAAASSISNDNSRVNHASSETHIGTVVVNTQATDADGIARGIGNSLRKYNYAQSANSGLA